MTDQPDMQQSDHPEHNMPDTSSSVHGFNDAETSTPDSDVNRAAKSDKQ